MLSITSKGQVKTDRSYVFSVIHGRRSFPYKGRIRLPASEEVGIEKARFSPEPGLHCLDGDSDVFHALMYAESAESDLTNFSFVAGDSII